MKFHLLKEIEQAVTLADFTDGEDATGYVDLDTQLPIGAIPLFWQADITTAFAGTTSTIMAGISTDTDLFSATTTNSGAAIAKKTSFALAPASTAARTIRLTVTDTAAEGADFGDFTGGAMTFKLVYYMPEV